jgi:DNA invertase Pin-like site-specific DNA recombinase
MKSPTWTLPPGTRAVLLCRVSDKHQTSLNDQETACRRVATDLGVPAKHTFVRSDDGVSGLKESRLEEIVAACERAPCNGGGPGYVIAFDATRFSRVGSVRVAQYKVRLTAAGWLVRYATRQPTGDQWMDDTVDALEENMGRGFSAMLQRKIPLGRRRHAAQGEYGGRPPFGLRRGSGGHLTFGAERDVATVRRIFWRYVAGATLQQIVAELDRDRIPPPVALGQEAGPLLALGVNDVRGL